jgi:hypothetical protein
MKRLLLVSCIVALYLLHQDFWLWREARPLVFGLLPVGLAYHAAYCVAVTVLMWTLTRVAWPSHLEESVRETTRDGPASVKASARSRRSAKREGGRR